MTERLARASAQHPRRVLAAWGITCVLALAAIVFLLGDALTGEAEQLNNPESQQAYSLLARRLPPPPNAKPEFTTDVVLVRSRTVPSSSRQFAQKVREVQAELRRIPGVLYVGDKPAARSRQAVAIEAGLVDDSAGDNVIDFVRSASDQTFTVFTTGEWTFDTEQSALSLEDLRKGELEFGLPVALIVLLLVFGAIVAGLIPVATALIAILVAVGLTGVVGIFTDLSVFTINMISGMGLALGIDYALFVVSRFREERTNGREKLDAIEAMGGTASRAVLFSGIAFVIAMFGLLLIPNTIFRSLATGAILVGAISVVAALTLLPAILSLLGDRVNTGRLPLIGRSAQQGTAAESRFWSRVVRGVMRRPGLSLGLSTAFLVVLAVPLLDYGTGEAGIRTMPDRFASKQGFLALEQEFGSGTTDTVQVVVDGDVRSPETRDGINGLAAKMRRNRELRRIDVEVHPAQRIAVIEALPAGDSRDQAALDTVEALRREEIPGARVLVTGETAESVDYFQLTDRWLPILIAVVLTLSFVLLTVAFRSIVVAGKAIVLNLLSVSAAYGILVLVFEKGVGNELFGFEQVDFIEAWVPLFLFAVLFGLSMDYHVFLLSRIRERYLQTGNSDSAVAYGIGSTSRLITGAALIIIAVFAGFAVGDLVAFQQMGFGVAVSLLIDATIIRSVLLPAAMKLLGDWNWYLPRWLHWLPDFHVEGSR